MWQLRNRTPFAAERTWARDRDGTETWLVAVKASFRFDRDGAVAIDAEQPPVNVAPVFEDLPGGPALRLDTDLPRTKVATDVVVLGSAHAPGGRATTRLDVAFAVGPVARAIRVHGDRVWARGRIGAPQPFTTMPLGWDRAYGGTDPHGGPADWDERNPVGRGYAVAASHVEGRSLPNLEAPDAPLGGWRDRPEPVSFAPIPCHWPARRRHAGTCDERWQRERAPLLPEDLDDRFYQCAPPEQQARGFLRGDEPIALRNLTPGGGDVRFAPPRVHLGFETVFFTGPSVRHAPPVLHTVILEPDAWRVSLVFHTALACHPRVLKLSHTVVSSKVDLRAGALKPLAGGVAA